MAFMMWWFPLIALINFDFAAAKGQFVVLHVPPALHFGRRGTPVEGNILKDIYLASLGFDFDESSDWDEIRLVNPFRMPEAAVAVHVEGVSSLGDFDDDARVYPLESFEAKTYEQVLLEISQQQYEPKGKLVNMMLAGDRGIRSYRHIFGDHTMNNVPPSSLKHSDKHFYRFERELQTLKAITASVKSGIIQSDGSSDFYSFKFTSLRYICINHGPDSKIMFDAKRILNHQIRELNKAFVASYNGDVIFTAVITDSVTIPMDALRLRRDCDANAPCAQACIPGKICTCETHCDPAHADNPTTGTKIRQCSGLIVDPATDKAKMDKPCVCKKGKSGCSCECDARLATPKHAKCACPQGTDCSVGCELKLCAAANTPTTTTPKKTAGTTDTAIINIIFFTCLGLYLSVLAVIYTMVTMDPGRDSIVYRMTSAIDRVKME